MMFRQGANGYGRGRPVAAPLVPDWYSAITPGDWGILSTSTLAASGLYQHTGGGTGVFSYSGGFINTKGIYNGATFVPGTFLCVWGGGHADYGGNEMYAFGPLLSNSPQWYRLRDRTVPFPENLPTGEDAYGNPMSRHTYDTMVYVDDGSRSEMLAMGGPFGYSDANNSDPNVRVFNFDQSDPNTNFPWSKRALVPVMVANTAAYDPSTGAVWSQALTGGTVQRYDVASNTFTSTSYRTLPGSGTPTSDIDTVRGIWANLRPDGTLRFFRTNDVTNYHYAPSVTGTPPGSGLSSIAYDAANDCFRVWLGSGKTIYTLTPPASSPYEGGSPWVWSSNTPSGGVTPSDANVSGTYGRFSYIRAPGISGCVLLNAATGSVYFYRT